MHIVTDRLIIREYEPADFPSFFALVSDPEIRFYSLLMTRKAGESARQEFDAILRDRGTPDRRRFVLAVCERASGAYLADAGFEILKAYAAGGIAEIGYLIAKDHWGRASVLKSHPPSSPAASRNSASTKWSPAAINETGLPRRS